MKSISNDATGTADGKEEERKQIVSNGKKIEKESSLTISEETGSSTTSGKNHIDQVVEDPNDGVTTGGGVAAITSHSARSNRKDDPDKKLRVSPTPPLQEYRQGQVSNSEESDAAQPTTSKRILVGHQQLTVTTTTVCDQADAMSYSSGRVQNYGIEETALDSSTTKAISVGSGQVTVSTTTVLDQQGGPSISTKRLPDKFGNSDGHDQVTTIQDGRNQDVPPLPQFLTSSSSRPGAYLIRGQSMERRITGFISDCNPDREPEQFSSEMSPAQSSTLDNPTINQNDGEQSALDWDGVTATALDEDELADKFREEMMRNAVQGEAVDPTEEHKKIKKRYIALCLLFSMVFLGVVIGLSVRLTKNNNNKSGDTAAGDMKNQSPTWTPTASPTETPMPTLERIQKRGKLNCGVSDYKGFYQVNNETGVGEGFQFDLCHAVAAAVFGDTTRDKVKPVVTKSSEKFIALQNKTIDLLASSPTHSMERDVYLESTGTGFSFASPYLYDGLGFAGIPPYGACADNISPYFGDCRLLRVCVLNQSSHVPVVKKLLPEPTIVLCDDVRDAFIEKSCNAMAGEKFVLAEDQLRSRGYKGDYEIGNNTFSKEPLALATRDDDIQWSDFVNMIMQALLAAEEQGVTQITASELSTTNVFGEEFENMFVNAIAAVGNYGEIYQRHLEPLVPREDVDMINRDGDTGLFLTNPFGQVLVSGPEPTGYSTLATIASRGHLRCGVTVRPFFAEFDPNTKSWIGLDADFCYALASSVFNRTSTNVTFVNLTEAERYLSLADGVIDVLAGASANVLTEVMEPSTRQGFSFSQPYFYDPPSGVADNIATRALATRQDDATWSSFVYWIVASFFYAEENYVKQNTSEEMPLTNLFGPAYGGMFQDAIFAVGNSKELYERNLEPLIPRSGRNQLNKNPLGPQHFPLPGI